MTFLGKENQDYLNDIFHLRYAVRWKEDNNRFKQGGKKFLIPIGLQRLKLDKIGYKKARNGSDMLEIQFYKSPEWLDHIPSLPSSYYKEKASYKPIACYHMVQNYSSSKLSDGWFKDFTACYTKDQLDQLLKHRKKHFMALIRHTEDSYNDNKFFRAEIVDVYKDGVKAEWIDYLELYKPLNNGKKNKKSEPIS